VEGVRMPEPDPTLPKSLKVQKRHLSGGEASRRQPTKRSKVCYDEKYLSAVHISPSPTSSVVFKTNSVLLLLCLLIHLRSDRASSHTGRYFGNGLDACWRAACSQFSGRCSEHHPLPQGTGKARDGGQSYVGRRLLVKMSCGNGGDDALYIGTVTAFKKVQHLYHASA
jgi:hypothetical protein